MYLILEAKKDEQHVILQTAEQFQKSGWTLIGEGQTVQDVRTEPPGLGLHGGGGEKGGGGLARGAVVALVAGGGLGCGSVSRGGGGRSGTICA